jgi:hypothetical protein
MTSSPAQIPVYLESGKKRVFAVAVEWPGWVRSARDEQSALQTLLEHAPRYAQVLSQTSLRFQPPGAVEDFWITERLEGNATTEFGGMGAVPGSDLQPLSVADLQRSQEILSACWQAFDAAVVSAEGKELRKGPRGGGREALEMQRHVLESEASYVRRLGLKLPNSDYSNPEARQQNRAFILSALADKRSQTSPGQGPRGGRLWMPREFIRHAAWHIVDHIWEIEDRS